jgi:hypothetical protein
MAVGTIVLLRYVSRIASRPIELHLDYPSSSSIVAHSENSNFDYIILSWGAALQLPRALRASAVMLLPRTEIELVTRHPAPKSIKTVVLANDKRGYPWQFFDALKKGGLPALRKTTLVDASLSEIPTALRSGATAAIVAAPFSSVLGTQLPVQVVKLTTDCGRLADNILFQPNSNRKAAETAAQFSRLIRSAWFELLENPERIKTEVTSLSADRAYQSTLSRLSGTLRFSAAT